MPHVRQPMKSSNSPCFWQQISKPATEGSSFGGFTAFASTSTPSGSSSSSGFGGFSGFASFQSSSSATFSSFAAPASSSGFGSTSTTASDFAEFGTAVGEKKADPVVPALSEAEVRSRTTGLQPPCPSNDNKAVITHDRCACCSWRTVKKENGS